MALLPTLDMGSGISLSLNQAHCKSQVQKFKLVKSTEKQIMFTTQSIAQANLVLNLGFIQVE